MRVQGKAKWMVGALAGALALLLALPAVGQSVENARFETVARRARHAKAKAKAKAAPAVSREHMELAREMVMDSYALGKRLELRQRVALMMRLLYTMRPEVMAEEKKQWAEELFRLAQELPDGSGNASLPAAGAEALATAAVRVAVYDSERALELLDTLPSEGGRREDARTMASRLVFAIYMQHHGAAGAQTLLAHGRKWGEHGGFPYEASAAALARLRIDEDAAEDFFRQVAAVFARGQEGVFGVREFAGLLDRAVALEAISDESAEEAGRMVVAQLGKLAGMETAGSEVSGNATGGNDSAAKDSATSATASNDRSGEQAAYRPAAGAGSGNAALPAAGAGPAAGALVTDEEQRQVAAALNDVRLSAPKAYIKAAKDWPGLLAMRPERVARAGAETGNAALPAAGAGPAAGAWAAAPVDLGLQESFGELAEALREKSGPEVVRGVIAKGLQRVNARYKAGECPECVSEAAAAPVAGAGGYAATDAAPAAALGGYALSGSDRGRLVPDGQSWALVSLAAYASPMTIAGQLKAIEEPFWRAYFMAIAAQQVGEPTRVADPTARRVLGKEEAEPE